MKSERNRIMKTNYIQPQVQIAQLASMPVMQAASGAHDAGDALGIRVGTTTPQW